MVIERPIAGFNPWSEAQQKPPSRGSVITIAVVAAVHLCGAAYLYRMHAAAPAPLVDPPAVLINPVRIRQEPTPTPKAAPPKAMRVHDPLPTALKSEATIALKPQPLMKEQTSVVPPVVAAQTLTKPDLGALTPDPQPKTIRNPNWLARPTAEQLADFYPPRALDREIGGQATLDCLVTAAGQLTHCAISAETPRGEGFAEAALKASRIFRMSPRTEDGLPVEGGAVHIPIRFAVRP